MLAIAPPVLICERTGAWAAAWRRVWSRRATHGNLAPRLIEVRSTQECREVAADHPATFVVAELTAAGVEQTLDLLFDLGSRFPGVASAVVAERAMSAYEELARELGALAFAVSPLDLEPVCDLAQRHLCRGAIEPSDIYEKIWSELPWS